MRSALLLARVIFGRCVDDIAGENLLPEGKASARACESQSYGLAVGGQAVVDGISGDSIGDRPPCKPYPEAMSGDL
ncbi:hypothetical protein RRF57_002981 [Xylaria bambusicola]|uniref:Uncharacterized protein n=1 Tax=Xylaria bambusicola TaxID=326684 RepID=A0AAN7UL23_9PEZI